MTSATASCKMRHFFHGCIYVRVDLQTLVFSQTNGLESLITGDSGVKRDKLLYVATSYVVMYQRVVVSCLASTLPALCTTLKCVVISTDLRNAEKCLMYLVL